MTNSVNKISAYASLFLAALPVMIVLAAVNFGQVVSTAAL